VDRQLEQRILSCPGLPTLPAVALELLRLCRSEDVDLRSVAGCVSRDPAIAARVLRVANSAAVARGHVATLTRAVPLLGSNTVLAIALSFSLVRGRRRELAAGFDHVAFWRRAVYSAVGSRALADQDGVDREEAFLAGLLQDLGVLALAEAFRTDYGDTWLRSRGDHDRLAELERERFGAAHPEVTELLARQWNLPEALRETALGSHVLPPRSDLPRPPEDGRRGRFRLVDCAYLSGRLADVWIRPDPATAVSFALDVARQHLHMTRDGLASALARMAGAIPDIAADFEIDLASEAEIQVALDQAREVLVRVALREATTLAEGGSAAADRAAFEAVLQDAFAAAGREGGVLTVGLCHLGALPGDGTPGRLVEQLARAIAGALHGGDVASALDRGLLALVLPGTSEKAAALFADRVMVRAPPSTGRVSGPSPSGGPRTAATNATRAPARSSRPPRRRWCRPGASRSRAPSAARQGVSGRPQLHPRPGMTCRAAGFLRSEERHEPCSALRRAT
jgi:HD-like signal output (HDOD) protein